MCTLGLYKWLTRILLVALLSFLGGICGVGCACLSVSLMESGRGLDETVIPAPLTDDEDHLVEIDDEDSVTSSIDELLDNLDLLSPEPSEELGVDDLSVDARLPTPEESDEQLIDDLLSDIDLTAPEEEDQFLSNQPNLLAKG